MDIRALKKNRVYEFDVEVVKILPVKLVSSGDDSIPERVYSIIGKDIILGYENVCYLTEKEYKKVTCKGNKKLICGDIITLQHKFLSNKL